MMSRSFRAFVLMPFSPEHKNTYEVAIKEACRSCKLICRRLDDSLLAENMLNELYDEIYKADLIIADLSGINPNVLFEAGYAYGLRKQIILLTDDIKELPFNLRPLRSIVFNKNDLPGLKKMLISAIRAYFKKMEFLPGQDENDLKPETDEKPLVVTGWKKWGDNLSIFADTNTIVAQGQVSVAGYCNDKLGRKLAGKTLVLYIANTEDSDFSMNRLLKMTVNSGDTLLQPKTTIPLISNEYIPAGDGRVEYVIPQNFDGKLGFVFYEANLNYLKIAAFVKGD
jgi:hypothetical protein